MVAFLSPCCPGRDQTMSTITNPTQQEQTEQEMVQCLRSGNAADFARLYDSYSASLYGFIIRRIRDTEKAENLLQDVFVKAWRNRHQYDTSKGKLFTWLFNIARHSSIDYLRSKAYKNAKASVLTDDMAALIPSGIAACSDKDTIGLRKLLNILNHEEKEMLELMYFKGCTQKEIAEILNTPIGTVKTKMSRAIKELRYYFNKDWKDAIKYLSLAR